MIELLSLATKVNPCRPPLGLICLSKNFLPAVMAAVLMFGQHYDCYLGGPLVHGAVLFQLSQSLISLGQSWLLGSFPPASLLTSVPSIASASHPLPWFQSSNLSSMWSAVAPVAAVLPPASIAAGPPALGSSGFVLFCLVMSLRSGP